MALLLTSYITFSTSSYADTINTTTNTNASSAGAPIAPILGDTTYTIPASAGGLASATDFTVNSAGIWSTAAPNWVQTATPGQFVNTTTGQALDLTLIAGQAVSLATTTTPTTPNNATFVSQAVTSSVLGASFANGTVASSTQTTNTYDVTQTGLNYTVTDINTATVFDSTSAGYAPAVQASTSTSATALGATASILTNVTVSAGVPAVTGSYTAINGTVSGSSSSIAADGTYTFNNITGTYVNNNDGSITTTVAANPLTTINSNGITTNAFTATGATTTNGITNTGAVTTDTLATTGAATVGGALAVTGATTTNGITNTGNLSTGTTTVNGNISVSGNSYLGSMTLTPTSISANGNVISNVGNAVAGTDAVNLNQLNSVRTNLQGQIDDNRKEARSGIASVAAMAGIPSLDSGKQFNIGVGLGSFKSESAIAIGSNLRLNENITAKAVVGFASSNTSVSGGISYNF